MTTTIYLPLRVRAYRYYVNGFKRICLKYVHALDYKLIDLPLFDLPESYKSQVVEALGENTEALLTLDDFPVTIEYDELDPVKGGLHTPPEPFDYRINSVQFAGWPLVYDPPKDLVKQIKKQIERQDKAYRPNEEEA